MSTHYPNISAVSGIGSVIKSLRKSLRSSSPTLSQNVPVINPVVVGGREGQQKLLQQLKSGPLPSRANAAVKVTESLEKYSISSVPEIWYMSRDLCEGRITSSIRRIGIKLMIECIKHDDLTVSGKLMYFEDIARYCQISESHIDPEFDLYLLALKTLSNNGKDIHDLYIYDFRRNLPTFLKSALVYLTKQAKSFNTQNEKLLEDRNYQNLHKLLEYVKNCLRLNYTISDKEFIVSVCDIATELGYQTTNETLISDCVELLNTVIVFGTIQYSSFSRIIQVFAYVYSKRNDQSKIVSESLVNMITETTFPTVFLSLCDVAKNFGNPITERDTIVVHTTIGALLLIEKLFIIASTAKASKIDYIHSVVIAAEAYVLEQKIPALNVIILQMLDRMFDKTSYSQNYSTTPQTSELFPFQVWYGSSTTLFDVLSQLSVNLNEDKTHMKHIINSLREQFQEHGLNIPRSRLVKFFVEYQDLLSLDDVLFVLTYYKDEKLCSAINPLWKESQQLVLNKFVYNTVVRDPTEETDIIRLESLRVIKESHFISIAIVPSYELEFDILKDIFMKLLKLNDLSETVLHYLSYEFFTDVLQNAPLKVFEDFTETILQGILSMGRNVDTLYIIKFTEAIAKFFITTKEAGKAANCYLILIKLGNFAFNEPKIDVLLIVLRTLIRLRVTSENFVYLTSPKDMEGLATAFRRTAHTIKEDALRNASQNGADDDVDIEKVTNNFTAHNYQWSYPESLAYLPERYFDTPTSKLLIESITSPYSQRIGNEESLDQDMATIDINLWLQIVLKIVEEYIDWEVYTFVWAHFCSQLSNLQLFKEQFESIGKFRRILNEHISLAKLPNGFEFPANVTKADLQVACIRNLSALIGYKALFSKTELEQMINSTLLGVDYSWEKTAIPIINFLTVCCYDIPLLLKKYLPVILSKLQTRVTNVFAMAHTLEFLLSLIDLPAVISSINTNEYKSVFGICFKYIQYSNDIRKRNLSPGGLLSDNRDLQAHGVDAIVELTPSTNVYAVTPIISQYLLQLSYDVIAYWFLKVAMHERKMISPFVIKNLILSNDSDMNEQLISMLDFVVRFTFCDIPVKVNQLQSVDKNSVSTKSWIIGYSVLSIIKKMNGKFQIIIRRPTGHIYFDINLNVDDNMVDNEYLLLQLFTSFDEHNKSKPIPLIDDSLTLRNLNMIDRIPMIDYHKIGILYIGKGQSTEEAVLLNKIGNEEYEKFIRQMGSIIRLKGCKDKYVGGLDTETDMDGEYAIHWSDKLTHLIFHTATMMEKNVWNDELQVSSEFGNSNDDSRIPTTISTGPESTSEHSFYMKKRHIGNNYVNIYFDDSGGIPFNFNLIKSQFNFINIVISHHTYSKSSITGHRGLDVSISGDGADLDDIDGDSHRLHTGGKHYKVKLYRRSGVPGVLSACHFKIVSEENLATYVRNLALRSSLFANTWHSNGEFFTTIWTHRVKQISLLREKTIKAHEELKKMEMEEESAWDLDDPYGNRGRSEIGFAGGHAGIGFGISSENKSIRTGSIFSGRTSSILSSEGKSTTNITSESDPTQSFMQQLNEGLISDNSAPLRSPTTPTTPNNPQFGSSMGTPLLSAKTKYIYNHSSKHSGNNMGSSNGNDNENAKELFLLFEFNSYT